MNERFKQLAEQANLLQSVNGMTHYRTQHKIEKFAELIVRECAELFVDQKYMILNPHEPFANERVRALKQHNKDTVRKIKQHFGVE